MDNIYKVLENLEKSNTRGWNQESWDSYRELLDELLDQTLNEERRRHAAARQTEVAGTEQTQS